LIVVGEKAWHDITNEREAARYLIMNIIFRKTMERNDNILMTRGDDEEEAIRKKIFKDTHTKVS